MAKCLLCIQSLKTKATFQEAIFFKNCPEGICPDCEASFVELSQRHCPSCYKKGSDTTCSDCSYWFAEGKQVFHKALYDYNEPMADYFSKYKFQGDYVLRKIFAKKLRLELALYSDYTIVPIPISPERLAERGFNQVEGLLDAAGLAYRRILGKVETDKQSSKNKMERLNLEQPFYILEESGVPDKIILVDDIYTTGATIQQATSLLVKMGKKEIKTFSLAR